MPSQHVHAVAHLQQVCWQFSKVARFLQALFKDPAAVTLFLHFFALHLLTHFGVLVVAVVVVDVEVVVVVVVVGTINLKNVTSEIK